MRIKNALKNAVRRGFNSLGLDLVRSSDFLSTRFFPYFLTKDVEGQRFQFFIGDSDGKDWYDNGPLSSAWPEMRFMRETILADSDVVLEVGAHHGFATVMMSKWIGPNGRIVSLEPNPGNFEIATINSRINGLLNVELRNLAAGAKECEIEMDVSSSNSHVLAADSNSSRFKCKVRCVTVDSFLDERPTVLKIDVEGFEKSVLDGASNLLKTRPKLLIEIHTEELKRYGTSVQEVFSLLGRDQYDYWVQWDDMSMPQPFNFEREIRERVHLFALPK